MPNLVGIGLSQVPTNSMLGGLAYQSPDHASIENLDLKYISQINAETADTAVDIFVYDTSKDSDGGAWRKRTSHTSWYNETLNTSTRGSRREFPAVAVIVVNQSYVSIYDGDDPDLPMWMVFDGNSSDMFTNGGTNYAVTSLNGILSLGENGAIWNAHFISDRGDLRNSSRRYDYKGNIEQRNDGLGYTDQETSGALVNSKVNDVAMTVLPNAPIDSTTGLPVPTIAVATAGGVSVIKDDGTVYDIDANGSTYQGINKIHFTPDDKLAFSAQQSGSHTGYYRYIIANIPNSDVVGAYWQSFSDELIDYAYSNYASTSIPVLFTNSGVSGNINAVSKSNSNKDNAIGGDQSLTLLSRSESQYTDMVAYATTSYNTGWMHGNIKGAFLSDTDATNATASELIVDGSGNWAGDFNVQSDVDSWVDWIAVTTSLNSGKMRITTTGTGYAYVYKAFTTVVGKQYVLNLDYTHGNNNHMYVRLGTNADGEQYSVTVLSSTQNFTKYFTATTTTSYITFLVGTGSVGEYGDVDNVSIKPVQEDRSVNNKGLQVFGTITKSAVATGAELVAYSGFSASNYLEQPYNSNLNYGTGDFYFGGWFKGAGYSDSLIGRLHDSSSAGKGFLLSTASSGASGVLVFAIYTLGFQSSGRTTVGTTTNETGKGWQQVWGIRRGGTMELWLNGNLVTTGSNSADISDTTYNPPLFIGVQHGSSVFDGELALMRTGASAPSPEQIKKMYEDEKVLFQENAKCTLYGSSDAVTALAYDDSNSILSVGTSSGRSDFQGLRRINNTTTAVTTAISAHDEFIVEQ